MVAATNSVTEHTQPWHKAKLLSEWQFKGGLSKVHEMLVGRAQLRALALRRYHQPSR